MIIIHNNITKKTIYDDSNGQKYGTYKLKDGTNKFDY